MSSSSDTIAVTSPPLAELRHVFKDFKIRIAGGRHGILRAVDGVTLTLNPASTLGLVGESGSGKSTIARLLLRLVDPTAGHILLDGNDITNVEGRPLRVLRRRMQLVFQDPYSSFDPLASIADSIAEALRNLIPQRAARQARTAELLTLVGLSPVLGRRHPGELSGGQLQRAAIARALALGPSLIALDEPVSSLDVSSQAHIIDLLNQLQADLGVAYLFITHDLSVVRDISSDIAVMYLGRIVETGPAEHVYAAPKHPYTQALMSAAPKIDPARQTSRNRVLLEGDIPSALNPPSGCRFHTRCPHVMDICRGQDPPPIRTADGTTVACHLYTTSSSEMVNPGSRRTATTNGCTATHRD
jgi:oligopeptide/dipeptide ABC transporter ATP-binding protein